MATHTDLAVIAVTDHDTDEGGRQARRHALFLINRYAAWVNRRGQQLSELRGSDSHVPYTAGQSFTWFPGRRAADLRYAIEYRQTRAAGSLWQPRSLARIAHIVLARGLPKRTLQRHYLEFPGAVPAAQSARLR